MELTKEQNALIECLKFKGITKDNIVGIMLMVKEQEQIAKMAEYLLENPTASSDEIMAFALTLKEEKQ